MTKNIIKNTAKNTIKKLKPKSKHTPKNLKARRPKTRALQVRSVQTRIKILEMTERSLATDGIHGLRYSHIAKLAKVPQALMGYHFPTSDALLFEVVQLELEKLKRHSVDQVEKNAAHPKKALAAYIRAPFELSATDSSFRAVWTAFYHLTVITPIFTELNSGIRKMGRERILNLITMVLATEGQLMGVSSLNRDQLLELATAVQGIITGLAIMAASETESNYSEFADLAVETSFKILGL